MALEDLEENGVGSPLSFDQLAKLFDLEHFGIIQITSSNVSLPNIGNIRRVSIDDLENAFKRVEKQFSVYNFMADTSKVENIEIGEKETMKNMTNFNEMEESESVVSENLEDDYYDYDYIISNSTSQKHLFRNVSGEALDHLDDKTSFSTRMNLHSEIEGDDTFSTEVQLEKNNLNLDEEDELFIPEDITIAMAQSSETSFLNKKSEDIQDQSKSSSNTFDYPLDHVNDTAPSNLESDLLTTQRTSYKLFGREYEFYDQLINKKIEETTYANAYELLVKTNNKMNFNDQIGDSISTQDKESNSTKKSSNIHLVLVTTETPELKTWKKRILLEEIKLLRLKQQLIQHQVTHINHLLVLRWSNFLENVIFTNDFFFDSRLLHNKNNSAIWSFFL